MMLYLLKVHLQEKPFPECLVAVPPGNERKQSLHIAINNIFFFSAFQYLHDPLKFECFAKSGWAKNRQILR